MNFFEAQEQARRGTRKMVILFVLAVLGTVLALNAVALGVAYWMHQSDAATAALPFQFWRPELFTSVSVVTVVLVVLASLFKTMQISGDGGKVARLMGGRLVAADTTDGDERKLLNVVEEMSIASGVSVPDVYVLDQEDGINAFAAGTTINDAAIGVTRGTIAKLNRDELQGVIAHEFSHILNGDMRLNMRLIGVVFGILVIGLIGYAFLRAAPWMMRGSSSSRDKGGGAAVGLAFLAVGAAVWLIGSLGVFFGRMIQAAVSRQREFLADASAVQFTRNPVGIRDALRKIGGSSYKATVRNRHAGEISHMWFGEALGAIFATHPPLPQRIKALDPRWDGTMLKAEFVDPRDEAEHHAEQRRSRPRPGFDPDALFGTIGLAGASPATTRSNRLKVERLPDQVGHVTPDHVQYAGLLMKALPPQITEAARDPVSARGLVIAMLLSRDRGVRLMQDEAAAQKDPEGAAAAHGYMPILLGLGPGVRMAVLDLTLPALRRLDNSTRSHFLSVLDDLIRTDERVEPFEFALYTMVDHQLRPRSVPVKYNSISGVAAWAQTLLSALAAAGHPDPVSADRAYRFGIGKLQQGQLKYEPNFTIEHLSEALKHLGMATPQIKQRILDAAAATVIADNLVTVEEGELVRAFAAVMACPIPPFLQVAPLPKAAPAKPEPFKPHRPRP